MKKIFAIALSILTTYQVYSQNFDRSIRPKPGPATAINMADAQSFTLPNGLKVFVVENHKLPSVSFQIDIEVDPSLQGNAVGYQDMIGELMSGGTKLKSKDEFNKQLDALGGSLNASSGGVYASCLTKRQNELMALLSEMILQPNFTQKELDKIKTQLLSNLSNTKDDPNAMSENLVKSLIYGKAHPYGEIVTEATVNKITLDMCKKYYNTYYKPNAAYMAVVGDITLEQAKALVTKYLGAWKKGVVPVAKYVAPKNLNGNRVTLVNKSGAVQSVVNVTYPINLKYGTPDVLKVKVANAVLGGGSNGRLFQNLRETHGWTYGSYSSVTADKYDNAGTFSATADCQTESTDSSVGEILKEMVRMRNEAVETKLLEDIKTNMAGKFALSLEDPKTLARNAINIQKYKMPADYYKNYLKNLAAINAADVLEISKKYIKPDAAYITVAGDKNEVAAKLAKYAASGKVENFNMYGQAEKAEAKVALPTNLKGIDVINNYIAAVGGIENWTNIKDITTKMDLSVSGQSLELIEIKKAPNKYFSELKGGGMVFQKKVFNGVKGKLGGMQGEKDMETEDIAAMKEEANFLGEVAFLDPSYKVELKGTEKVEGKDAYVVKVTNAKGDFKLYYYDVASKLKVKSSETVEMGPGQKATVSSFYSNYQVAQGGMKLPYTIKQVAGPQVFDIKVKSFELNTGVDDKIFE
ncbi:MAG: pitrilysin family protein [Chitinophagaceae bacterium]|nr:pitrilysin family protein [Chitinophagaceae bacterium]